MRYYRREAGSAVALRLVTATNRALDQMEASPRIGSLEAGEALEIDGLRIWPVARFPLMFLYFERRDHLDVVRLLGDRQDISAIIAPDIN